jgi:hypothetical protein
VVSRHPRLTVPTPLAIEHTLVDYAIEVSATAGEIRTEALNTCPIDQVVALGRIFDQLFNNERNAVGEAASRMGGVLWAVVHRRSGYTQADAFTTKTLDLFEKNLERSGVTNELIAGAQYGSCVDQPAAAPST